MFRQLLNCFTLIFLLIKLNNAEDTLIQIQFRKPINVISEKFVSFSIDPKLLFDDPTSIVSENTYKMALSLQPAYLRVSGSSTTKCSFALSDENSENDVHETNSPYEISTEAWTSFHLWLKTVNWTPIVALNYNPQNWKPRDILRIIGLSKKFGIKNCVWQLGSGFNTTDGLNYADDLNTLRTIVDSFDKENKFWSVVGADISIGSDPEEVKIFSEFVQNIVDAIGWTQPIELNEHQENIFSEKDLALKYLTKREIPIWFTYSNRFPSPKRFDSCGQRCVLDGLLYAQTLGDAAKGGFNVLFKSLERKDIVEPGFIYFISLIHKKTIGQKVFDTKIISGDKTESHFYTYCSHRKNGSITIMGVNMGDVPMKVATKMTAKSTGNEIYQYLLTVNDGTILLNNDIASVSTHIEPFIKFKRANRAINLNLPAFSVGFWMFPQANLRECYNFIESNDNHKNSNVIPKYRVKTSSDALLQDLIVESIKNESPLSDLKRNKRHSVVKKDSVKRLKRNIEINKLLSNNHFIKSSELNNKNIEKTKQREKRQVSSDKNFFDFTLNEISTEIFGEKIKNDHLDRKILKNKKLKRGKREIENFNFKLPKLNLKKDFISKKLPKISKFNLQPPSIPTIPSFMTRQEKRNSAELAIFRPSENKMLPKGDVHLEVGDDRQVYNKDYDYIQFDDDNSKTNKNNAHNPNIYHQMQDVPDAEFANAPNEYYENYQLYQQMKEEQQNQQPIPFGELWEADVYRVPEPPTKHGYSDPIKNSNTAKVENIDYIMKELEPTRRQNFENLRKAQMSLNSYYPEGTNAEAHPVATHPFNPNAVNSNNPTDFVYEAGFDEYEEEENDDKFFETREKTRIKRNLQSLENIQDDDNNNAGAELLDDNEIDIDQLESDRITLMSEIEKIVDSLEIKDKNISDSDLENRRISLFDIKQLINLIKNTKFSKKRVMKTNDIQKQCKLLAISSEQQCLRDANDKFKIITKRAIKYMNENKTKKLSKLTKEVKNLNKDLGNKMAIKIPDLTDLNTVAMKRPKRNAVWQDSWESLDHKNSIVKIINHDADLRDDIGPSVPIISTNELYEKIELVPWTRNDGEEDEILSEHSAEIINEKNNYYKIKEKEEIKGESNVEVELKTENPHILLQQDINLPITNNTELSKSDKIMLHLQQTISEFMDVMHNHLMGWWKMLV